MHRWIAVLILCGMFLAGPCLAAKQDFFEKKAEGWFWYEDPPVPEEKKEEEEKPKPELPEPPAEKQPEEEPAPEESGPAPLSAVWITENLPKYLNRALDDPSAENVSAYLYLQRLAMDKSQKFADQAQSVVVQDYLLDENSRRPTASFGASAANEEATATTRKLMRELAEDVGVWMFFKSDCSYCEKQMVVQEILANKYGITTIPISLDGKALPGMKLGPVRVDEGQAAQLGVMQTPALFLAKPETNEIVPLGQSMFSLDQIERRILVAAASVGWISPQMFDQTRRAQGQLLETPELDNPERINENPTAIIEILRQQINEGQNAK